MADHTCDCVELGQSGAGLVDIGHGGTHEDGGAQVDDFERLISGRARGGHCDFMLGEERTDVAGPKGNLARHMDKPAATVSDPDLFSGPTRIEKFLRGFWVALLVEHVAGRERQQERRFGQGVGAGLIQDVAGPGSDLEAAVTIYIEPNGRDQSGGAREICGQRRGRRRPFG
ncbi:MAG: hypothetical protein GDA40_05490 [Rhodobacteraceae bacterium]|nr:hypothetical protein [Paracoccaceae bacterium]